MNTSTTKLPTAFWIIAILAVIWNAMGIFSFYGQVFMSEEALQALTEAQRELFVSTPSWLNFVFAIAVLTGLLGSIGLLLKKGWSVTLFLVSLLFVIVQMTYSFFMTKAVEVYGTTSIVLSIIVLVIAGFLYYYSKNCRIKGWLN